MIIAFIGGTGPEGKGLAYRFARAGTRRDHRVAECGASVGGGERDRVTDGS